ncbi:hypothetical protein BDF19DRAFT_437504 [Syncephalis fuscata]|nr:hypothetical protein BDF19DRAFT_437504 [Syncephalis fuscata]
MTTTIDLKTSFFNKVSCEIYWRLAKFMNTSEVVSFSATCQQAFQSLSNEPKRRKLHYLKRFSLNDQSELDWIRAYVGGNQLRCNRGIHWEQAYNFRLQIEENIKKKRYTECDIKLDEQLTNSSVVYSDTRLALIFCLPKQILGFVRYLYDSKPDAQFPQCSHLHIRILRIPTDSWLNHGGVFQRNDHYFTVYSQGHHFVYPIQRGLSFEINLKDYSNAIANNTSRTLMEQFQQKTEWFLWDIKRPWCLLLHNICRQRNAKNFSFYNINQRRWYPYNIVITQSNVEVLLFDTSTDYAICATAFTDEHDSKLAIQLWQICSGSDMVKCIYHATMPIPAGKNNYRVMLNNLNDHRLLVKVQMGLDYIIMLIKPNYLENTSSTIVDLANHGLVWQRLFTEHPHQLFSVLRDNRHVLQFVEQGMYNIYDINTGTYLNNMKINLECMPVHLIGNLYMVRINSEKHFVTDGIGGIPTSDHVILWNEGLNLRRWVFVKLDISRQFLTVRHYLS